MFALLRRVALIAALTLVSRVADAQIVCDSATGPDVVVADLVVIKKWGTVSGITGYSIGSLACNVGDTPLEWTDDTNRHPVIAQNAYRLKNGRFEQIGMSWLKHGFYALANSDCCECNDPDDPSFLGVGCSDAYDANLNGLQAGFNGVAGLGPRSEVNATTGAYLFPYGHQGEAGDFIYKRLQIRNGDLNPDLNADALYFAELQYITPDDAAAGNGLNNASYMPIQVGALNNGGYPLSYAGAPRTTQPAIYAWQEFDSSVTITPVDVPDDGRYYVGSKVTDLGNGEWRYEYAIFNLNSHRSARQFRVAVPGEVEVDTIGFHDVDYHSGEPFDGTDWDSGFSGGNVTWTTSTFEENENANALRWSTLYNFRFKATAPPGSTTGTLLLFRPGAPNNVTFSIPGPVPDGGAAPANDACADALDVDLGSTVFQTNEGATTDGAALACSANAGADVWFRFTPTFSGQARFSLCGTTDFDSVLAVYEGCGCGVAITPVRCNDNACGSASKVTLPVQAGTCYLVRIAGAAGATGVGTLRIEATNADNAVNASAILTGDTTGERFGQSVAAAGDFKNDGPADVVIGADRNDDQGDNAGRGAVIMGDNFSTAVSFSGESAGDNFGRVVGGGCDFNDDGFDDILIGAPFNDDTGTDAGKVYCFSGFDDSVLWIMRGQLPGDRLGSAISCVGDQNGDGVADALIGAPLNDIGGGNAGRAYIVAGQDGSVITILTGRSNGEQFGAAVTAMGDVNADGVKDFAIASPRRANGASSNAGRVTLYSGVTRKPLQSFNGAAGERLGTSLAGVTLDVDGTTTTYLAMGAPNSAVSAANSGRVRVFTRNHTTPGGAQWLCSTLTINGAAAGDRFGAAVDLANVLAGAAPELLVGEPGADANGVGSGAVSVISIASAATMRRIVGETTGDALGTSLAAAGDLNDDGWRDFVIGAPTNDAGGSNAGRAYVFLSQSGALLTGGGIASADDGEGTFVASPLAGDVDGDGDVDSDDLLAVIGAWGTCQPGACPADVDGSGAVDINDLLLVLAR